MDTDTMTLSQARLALARLFREVDLNHAGRAIECLETLDWGGGDVQETIKNFCKCARQTDRRANVLLVVFDPLWTAWSEWEDDENGDEAKFEAAMREFQTLLAAAPARLAYVRTQPNSGEGWAKDRSWGQSL